jgi:hypothetical protein
MMPIASPVEAAQEADHYKAAAAITAQDRHAAHVQ